MIEIYNRMILDDGAIGTPKEHKLGVNFVIPRFNKPVGKHADGDSKIMDILVTHLAFSVWPLEEETIKSLPHAVLAKALYLTRQLQHGERNYHMTGLVSNFSVNEESCKARK